MISFRFLFRLNVSIGFSLKVFASLLFVNNVSQLLSITDRIFGRLRLCLVINLSLLSSLFSLYVRNYLRLIALILANCLLS